MSIYYYKKTKIKNIKKAVRFFALAISFTGMVGVLYIFFPLLSWQFYFQPVFASNTINTPIPKTAVLNPTAIQSLIQTTVRQFVGVDYTNAQNWFPNAKTQEYNASDIPLYAISIPRLDIKNAQVATTDYDLSKHLVNYPGTPIPSQKGNAVVFGHSTLPQLFNPADYKTIFATAYKLTIGDEIFVSVAEIVYKYTIVNITVVDSSDTSIFAQSYDNSYLTLVTCTPPGTTWKRLIIKSRLDKL